MASLFLDYSYSNAYGCDSFHSLLSQVIEDDGCKCTVKFRDGTTSSDILYRFLRCGTRKRKHAC